jgi:hypothetical protein
MTLRSEAAILLSAGFALLVVYALPDLKAWARGAPPVVDQCFPPAQPGPHKPARMLTMPLLYDATVTQSGPGQAPRTAFYTLPRNR